MRIVLAGVVALFLLIGFTNQQGSKSSLYLLPFPSGDSAELIQGPHGRWGHRGQLEFAYDFIRPIGSPIIAGRSGKVVGVESQYIDGNRTPGQENYIFIAHSDSTYSRYYHLTHDGVRVKLGQWVEAGDTIGSTGDTGASAGPHLHFDVTIGCPEWGCQTIPIKFKNAGADSLEAGKTYKALIP